MPNPPVSEMKPSQRKAVKAAMAEEAAAKMKGPFKMKSPLKGKISPSCKARAKKKFKVWPSAYASGWGVRCTQGKLGKKKKKK